MAFTFPKKIGEKNLPGLRFHPAHTLIVFFLNAQGCVFFSFVFSTLHPLEQISVSMVAWALQYASTHPTEVVLLDSQRLETCRRFSETTVRFMVNNLERQKLVRLMDCELKMQKTWLKPGVSKNNGTPKSSILIGFSIYVHHPFWGLKPPIFGNTQPEHLTGKNLKDDVWNTILTFWASATYC